MPSRQVLLHYRACIRTDLILNGVYLLLHSRKDLDEFDAIQNMKGYLALNNIYAGELVAETSGSLLTQRP